MTSIPRPVKVSVVYHGRCIEFFAGCGIWSTSMAAFGWSTSKVDFLNGPQFNLADDKVVDSYCCQLRSGLYRCVHIATECTTFSRGTRPPYRNNEHLHGIKQQSAERRAKTETGTKLALNSIKLYKAAEFGRALVSWENPAESMLWCLPEAETAVLQKPWTFNMVTCYNFDFPSACRQCNHKRHLVQLRGYNPEAGCLWTKSANRYPRPLVMGMAKAATERMLGRK